MTDSPQNNAGVPTWVLIHQGRSYRTLQLSGISGGGLEQFDLDCKYLNTHWQDLVRRYPEQYVAIRRETVAAIALTEEQLVSELEEQGIAPEHTYIEYLARSTENGHLNEVDGPGDS